MRGISRIILIYLVSLFFIPFHSVLAEGNCEELIKGGVFNIEKIMESYESKRSFYSWQCSMDFHTHQEAIDAGLKIGTEVYGVPLEVGGVFDRQKKDEWMNQNCSQIERNEEKSMATYRFVKTVDEKLAEFYVMCISKKEEEKRKLEELRLKRYSPISTSVGRAGTEITYSVLWNRVTGETSDSAPIVIDFEVSNASCTKRLKPGDRILEGGLSISCTPSENRTVVFILNTNRGSRIDYIDSLTSTKIYAGTMILNQREVINEDLVIFKSNAEIITNGYPLKIDSKKIEVEGGAKITSFKKERRGNYQSGNSANEIQIFTNTWEGSTLEIDNSGEEGLPGVPGQKGGPGEPGKKGSKGRTGSPGTQGKQAEWDPIRGCHGRTDSTPGGRGGDGEKGETGGKGLRGGAGTNGGDGGNGGNISFFIRSNKQGEKSTQIVATSNGSYGGIGGKGGEGGDGGPGGPGGDGGDGGPGGASVPGTLHCDGGPAGAPGSPGNPGPQGNQGIKGDTGNDGIDGKNGLPGKIIDFNIKEN